MKQKPFTIHFVCRGNTYRSRLAAAYFDSLSAGRFVVTSSGIGTHAATVKTVEAYTKATAKRHGLTHGIAVSKTQTTDKLLADADIIVFMNKDVYDDALKEYKFDTRKAQVWHVKDMDAAVKQQAMAEHDTETLDTIANRTFAAIRKHCDELYSYATRGSWVDVVDKQNQPAGIRLPISWVTDRGLWHRGIHVVAQTVDGKFVVGKRDKAMVFAPGMLEITLGGAIDSGELPLLSAQRETHEELGVLVPQKHFRPLFQYQQVGYHPRYRKQTRAHLYVYAVTLPVHSARLRPQPGEVEELRLLTKRQVKHMLSTHRVEHFGRLKWGYKLYQKAVAYSSLPA